VNGTAGSDWDFLSSIGSLTVNSTSGDKLVINATSLEGSGFDPTAESYKWQVANFTGNITGFSPEKFQILTSGFNGTSGLGTFSVSTNSTSLALNYRTLFVWSGGNGSWSVQTNWLDNAAPVEGGPIQFAGPGGISTNDAKVHRGESVVIFGGGGIGLGAVLGAKLTGADPIIGIDLHDHKLAKAAEYGLTHQINASRESAAERVKEMLVGLADVTIDGTGNPKVIETAYDLAKLRGGRCVLFGVMPSDQRVSIHTLPLHFGRVLTGSEGGQSKPDVDIPAIIDVLGSHGVNAAGFVSHRGSLESLPELVDGMRRGEVVHAIIRPD
jgi:hypothetical protein